MRETRETEQQQQDLGKTTKAALLAPNQPQEPEPSRDATVPGALLSTVEQFRAALQHPDVWFRVEREGVQYDISISEGGERVCAWPAAYPSEDVRSVKCFGETYNYTGIPRPEVADNIAAWLVEASL